MSTQALLIALSLCAAFASPWLFTDWLLENSEVIEPDNVLQKRPFVRVEKKPDAVVPPLESKPRTIRRLNQAILTPFETSSNVSNSVNTRGNWSPKAEAAKSRHYARLGKELSKKQLQFGSPVFCRIFKQEKALELWIKPKGKTEFSLFKTYKIISFPGNLGPKRKAVDNQAPEGFYFVTPSQMIADQQINIGFDLGYPNQFDSHWERDGSTAFVSSSKNHRNSFIVSAQDMEEVFLIMATALDSGQKIVRIHSFPFMMIDKGLDKKLQSQPRNDFFWANLKEGYDFFEILRRPPNVTVSSKGLYTFSPPTSW